MVSSIAVLARWRAPSRDVGKRRGGCCTPTREPLRKSEEDWKTAGKGTNFFHKRGIPFAWLARNVGQQERPHLCCTSSSSALYVSARLIVLSLISTLAAIRASPASSFRTAPQPTFTALACTINQSSYPSALWKVSNPLEQRWGQKILQYCFAIGLSFFISKATRNADRDAYIYIV